METIQPFLKEYGFWLVIGVLALGIILGFTKTIVVYRDYADLTKVFMLVLAPVAILLVVMQFGEPPPEWKKRVLTLMGILEVGLLSWILVTTFLDNRNIFKTLLAFVTKIPLAIIFAIYLVETVSPGGKTSRNMRKNRGNATLILMALSPILYGLVRHKVWTHTEETTEHE